MGTMLARNEVIACALPLPCVTQVVLHGISVTHGLMANLTISVDDQVLRRARIRALQRNESVNRYLAETLERYADGDDGSAAEGLIALARSVNTGHVGEGRGWTREELHRG